MSDLLRTAAGSAWSWRRLSSLSFEEARRVLGSSALAEDAAQEAVMRAWRHREACRTPERPDAWMRAIARREALRLARASTAAAPLPLVEEHGSAGDDELSLLRLHVRRALHRLTRADRQLVVGRYWQDLSDHELATRLGIEQTTVRVRLHRIRGRLRHTLLSE